MLTVCRSERRHEVLSGRPVTAISSTVMLRSATGIILCRIHDVNGRVGVQRYWWASKAGGRVKRRREEKVLVRNNECGLVSMRLQERKR